MITGILTIVKDIDHYLTNLNQNLAFNAAEGELQDRRIILKAFKKLKGAHSRRLNIFGQAYIFIFIIVAIFYMRHFEQWSDSIFVQWARNSSMINLINIIKRLLN